MTRRSINHYSFKEHVLLFAVVPNTASAAHASAWDSEASYGASAWLDVFANAPPGSGPSLLREFCRATADIASGKISSALHRYRKVRQRLEHRVVGMPQRARAQLLGGCLFGEAQALVTNSSPRALEVAAAIDQHGALSAYYVESVRATHHVVRGELAKAAVHRARAESFAFRGGVSWSALSLLTTRWVVACVLTGDVVELIRTLADLELLSTLSPGLKAVHQLAQAHLDGLNGRREQAVSVYQQVLDTALARSLPTYAVERGLHARALNSLGRYAEARLVCLNTTRELEVTGHDSNMSHVILTQQLAIAEGRLGNPAQAAALLEPCLELARQCGNPLWSGMLHRTAAELAKLAGDETAAATHLARASVQFALTGNPQLMRECEPPPKRLSLTPPSGSASAAETVPSVPQASLLAAYWDTTESIPPAPSQT